MKFLAIFCIVICLVACTGTNSPNPVSPYAEISLEETTTTFIISTSAPTSTQLPTTPPTATQTPIPTATNPPTITPFPYTTMQPFPTVTPVGIYPVKQVFIQAGGFGGDGGSVRDFYFGRGTPSLVIYTDGQVIMKVGSWEEDFAFLSGQLPPEELCEFLDKLESTGFFDPIDMIYAFDETTQHSDGAGTYVIQVNGPITKNLGIYGPYQDYLVDEIASAFQLVTTYQPSTTLAPYVPEHLLLWIEPNNNAELSSLPNWPAEFLPLSELRSDPSSSKVIIEKDMILPLLELFDYKMGIKTFGEGEQGYDVILRPLLPHETPRQFSTYPGQPSTFNLPFMCDNLNLAEVIPTPTPTPLMGTLAPKARELSGRIVFSSDRDGNDEIYVMYANGNQATRLTNYPGSDSEPVWSPDGQKIAFVSDRSGRDEIYIMNADGTDVTRLTFSQSYKESPAWSPDGSRIVYVDTHNADFPDFDSEIHVVEIKDTDSIQLTDNGKRVGDITPIWFDLNRIVYASGDYPDWGLHMMQDDGSEQIFLDNGSQPSLSLDGKQIAYVITEFVTIDSSHYSENNEIYVATLSDLLSDQGSSTRVTEEDKFNHSPSWSPDGKHIVFVSSRDGNSELYIMNPDGSDKIRLTYTASSELNPDWAP